MLARRSAMTLALAASIAAVPLTPAGAQSSTQEANRTIKIGVLTDFSSAYAEYSGKY